MSPKATPEVGDDGLELATGPGLSFGGEVDVDSLGVSEIAQDDDDNEPEAGEPGEPVAEPAPTPTSRRSQQGAERKSAINLDDLDEFRKWKAEMDRKVQSERERAAELERQLEQQRQQQEAAYVQSLEAQLGQTYEPDQQRALIEQIAQVRARTELDAWAQWESYVAEQAKAAGLEPTEFKARSYQGEAGLHQFQADLNKKVRSKLEAENVELRKKADSVQEQVKRMVAETLASHGLDVVDTGAPAAPRGGSDDDWKRDMRLFNSGKMTREQFRKRWGT